MIVAIESASADVSIALADSDGTLRRVDGWSAGPRQSHELLPRITALLVADDIAMADISALAVGTGPGSFTGLRVGMSVAKGLAVALDRPIIGVPSLPAWLESEPDAAAAVARAGARDAYLLRRDAASPEIVDRDALASRARSSRRAGGADRGLRASRRTPAAARRSRGGSPGGPPPAG